MAWHLYFVACEHRVLVMIGRHFFSWARNVSAGERAEGVASLVQDYLYMELTEQERHEVEGILTVMLEDSSPLVRRSMAESLARASSAPHHIIMGLAFDQPEIAAIVLGRSPVLADHDLIDCAAAAGPAAQVAIAERPELSAAVAAAIAESGDQAAVVALAGNAGACVSEVSLLRILARFGSDGAMREALLGRPHLPASVRIELAAATGHALAIFASSAGWLGLERGERVAREAREKVTVAIAAEAADKADAAPMALARYLRHARHLTPGLLLRALLSADRALFVAALCELTGLPLDKVAALVEHRQSQGFHALYKRAGMPEWLLPAFQAVLAAQSGGTSRAQEAGTFLQRRLVDETLRACSDLRAPEAGKLTAMLRRFQAEAAREEVRGLVVAATSKPSLPTTGILLDIKPGRDLRIAA
jgi:uncharacterized protein (DUF2336 family)